MQNSHGAEVVGGLVGLGVVGADAAVGADVDTGASVGFGVLGAAVGSFVGALVVACITGATVGPLVGVTVVVCITGAAVGGTEVGCITGGGVTIDTTVAVGASVGANVVG